MKGFSLRNIKYMRQWFQFWSNAPANGQQLVAQIPWGHNLVIISKSQDRDEALFYVQKTIENNWSRSVLTHHIELGLYQREGRAIQWENDKLNGGSGNRFLEPQAEYGWESWMV